MSVYVVCAFAKLREMLASNKELLRKFDELERKLQSHDQAIVGILNAIRELMSPPVRKRARARERLKETERIFRHSLTGMMAMIIIAATSAPVSTPAQQSRACVESAGLPFFWCTRMRAPADRACRPPAAESA